MDVHLITDAGIERHSAEELEDLLRRGDGFVWVDMATCDEQGVRVLSEVFSFHPLAVRDCVERNRVPKVRSYSDHVLIALHAPERGESGHVHFIELDQFIGSRYLMTVHGPINPAVDVAVALQDTRAVLERIEAGRFLPSSPFKLSYAIVSRLVRRQAAFVETLAGEVWSLEQRVTAGHIGDPERFFEELFRVRHGLLAVRTMSAQSREVYGRMATLARSIPPEGKGLVEDIMDQLDRVRSIAEDEKNYLQGVIEFYRTRTETKMTIAAERLAVIAVLTLPITALSSILGMNVIVNDRSDPVFIAVVLTLMVVMSGMLLRWTKRQGWW